MMRWKLVPVEPTEEMTGETTKFVRKHPLQQRAANATYAKMLAAAPPASQDEELVDSVAGEIQFFEHGYEDEIKDRHRNLARAVLKMLEDDHG